jgi:hypothetical protein
LLGKTAGVATDELLASLVGVQNEQLDLLKGIRADVGRLLQGPWETARSYMHRANYPGLSEAQILQELGEARRYLYEAVPLQAPGSWERAAVGIDLTFVLSALGDRLGARDAALAAWPQGVAGLVNEGWHIIVPQNKIMTLPRWLRSKQDFPVQLVQEARAKLPWRGGYDQWKIESDEFLSSATLSSYREAQSLQRIFYMAETLEQLRALCCALDPLSFPDNSKPHFSAHFYLRDMMKSIDLYIRGYWPIEDLQLAAKELAVRPLWFLRDSRFPNHFGGIGMRDEDWRSNSTISEGVKFRDKWRKQFRNWFPDVSASATIYVRTDPEIFNYTEQPPNSISVL